jgi:hypothetical protein
MPPRETGKQRASRIPLDYYKRPNPMERVKGRFALLALLFTVGIVGGSFLRGDSGKSFVSRGQVTAVHAAWNDKCEACHVDFTPISRNNIAASLFGSPGGHDFASNLRCEQCHSGTAHHEVQLLSATPGCGGCHRDHRGLDAKIARGPDADCTSCHGDLKGHQKPDAPLRYENAVVDFASHPEFKILRDKTPDPGKLKFNHKLHMTPGQVITPGQANPYTLDKIADPKMRERYAKAPWQGKNSGSDLVVLDCASCHSLDAGDFGIKNKPHGLAASALTPRAAGDYYLPISHEAHCSACHATTFDKDVLGSDKLPLSVPHHLEPDEVERFLWGAYADHYLEKNPDLDAQVKDRLKQGQRPLPGKAPIDLGAREDEARKAIDQDVKKALGFLYQEKAEEKARYLSLGSCAECHYTDPAGGGKASRIVPPAVKDVWFEHARFNHVSHRAVDCRSCHVNAYAKEADGVTWNKNASDKSKDVLIAGVDSCRECHAPSATKNGQAVGGVRHDCVECHSYHHGDQPLQGLGAAARDPGGADKPKRFNEVSRFLKGAAD